MGLRTDIDNYNESAILHNKECRWRKNIIFATTSNWKLN